MRPHGRMVLHAQRHVDVIVSLLVNFQENNNNICDGPYYSMCEQKHSVTVDILATSSDGSFVKNEAEMKLIENEKRKISIDEALLIQIDDKASK